VWCPGRRGARAAAGPAGNRAGCHAPPTVSCSDKVTACSINALPTPALFRGGDSGCQARATAPSGPRVARRPLSGRRSSKP
jgi:hypothetical protein